MWIFFKYLKALLSINDDALFRYKNGTINYGFSIKLIYFWKAYMEEDCHQILRTIWSLSFV